jgi:serine/threonine-protein kinase
VVSTEYLEIDPALSPDGRWLAYTSTRTGRNEIWVQRYPDGVAARISSNGGYEPRWSADSRELFYLQDTAMMAVAVEAGEELAFAAPVELFRGRYLAQPAIILSSYDVARDGRFLMIELPESSSPSEATGIVVVQNWTEELKRRVPGRSAQ